VETSSRERGWDQKKPSFQGGKWGGGDPNSGGKISGMPWVGVQTKKELGFPEKIKPEKPISAHMSRTLYHSRTDKLKEDYTGCGLGTIKGWGFCKKTRKGMEGTQSRTRKQPGGEHYLSHLVTTRYLRWVNLKRTKTLREWEERHKREKDGRWGFKRRGKVTRKVCSGIARADTAFC